MPVKNIKDCQAAATDFMVSMQPVIALCSNIQVKGCDEATIKELQGITQEALIKFTKWANLIISPQYRDNPNKDIPPDLDEIDYLAKGIYLTREQNARSRHENKDNGKAKVKLEVQEIEAFDNALGILVSINQQIQGLAKEVAAKDTEVSSKPSKPSMSLFSLFSSGRKKVDRVQVIQFQVQNLLKPEGLVEKFRLAALHFDPQATTTKQKKYQ